MFEASNVVQLNELETLVFDYIVANPEKVQKMTIRDLAKEIHISTSSIVRMSVKLGFSGWTDLKYFLKKEGDSGKTSEETHYDNMLEFDIFLHHMQQESYQKQLNKAAAMLHEADYIIFLGLGTSGSLASYGSKYFVNMGLAAYEITDPFQGVPIAGNPIVVVISASGETSQVINKEIEFKSGGAKIISITNNETCTVSKLANLHLSYNIKTEWSKLYPLGNVTTSLPILAILEILAYKTVSILDEEKKESNKEEKNEKN